MKTSHDIPLCGYTLRWTAYKNLWLEWPWHSYYHRLKNGDIHLGLSLFSIFIHLFIIETGSQSRP